MRTNETEEIFNIVSGRYNEDKKLGNAKAYMDYCSSKSLSCFCSICKSVSGKINGKSLIYISMKSEDFTMEELYDAMEMYSPFRNLNFKCKKCGKVTPHFTVDEGLEELISEFNKIGFETEYCCEGHYHSDLPYIMFKRDLSTYFDKNNKLLKYWNLEIGNDKLVIRVSSDATIKYVEDNLWREDMLKYIRYVIKPCLFLKSKIDN